MLGVIPAAHAVVELRIAAEALVAEDQPRGDLRVRRPQPLQHRQDRIARIRDAEDQLVGRVVEPEARQQGFLAERFQAAQGPHHRDGCAGGESRGFPLAPDPQGRHGEAGEVDGDEGRAEREGGGGAALRQGDHARRLPSIVVSGRDGASHHAPSSAVLSGV